MDEILSYIQPELLVLVPVLYLMGMGIKKSKTDDSLIPMILGLMGMMLACLYGFATMSGGDSVAMVLFTGIVQGILCAGCSVYANQLLKQGGLIE